MNSAKQTAIDLLQMQHEYDLEVFQAHGISGYEDLKQGQVMSALFDEMGELNHEVKKRWCWWKKTQAEEDMEKIKEELADVMHFIFMIVNAHLSECFEGTKKGSVDQQIGYMNFENFWRGFGLNPAVEKGLIVFYMRDLIQNPMHNPWKTGWNLRKLIAGCGLSVEEAIEAYKAKNAINRQRVKDGY